MTKPPVPIVCDMTHAPDTGEERVAEYQRLFDSPAYLGRRRTSGAIRFCFRSEPGLAEWIRDLAAREKACCAFFEFTNTDQVDYRSAEPRPGQSGTHTAMTNTRNTPIEALERAFPLRVLRYRLRRGSGGAGWSAGGEGIERDLQVLEDATVSLITERRVSQPWGLAGGEPGAVGENWLLPGGDETRAERLPDKCTIQLKAGDVLRMLTPGGGGWGSPRQ